MSELNDMDDKLSCIDGQIEQIQKNAEYNYFELERQINFQSAEIKVMKASLETALRLIDSLISKESNPLRVEVNSFRCNGLLHSKYCCLRNANKVTN